MEISTLLIRVSPTGGYWPSAPRSTPHFYWFYREDPQLAGELGDLAFYTISPDSFGIYQARLVRYEVPDLVTPPEHVLLVRSARRWVGF